MWRHYLKIAGRNIKKNKAFSIINISGLAIGIACCLLILVFVTDELSYDRYHVNGERAFRINSRSTIGGVTRQFAASPAALAPAAKESIPEIEAYVRFFRLGRFQAPYEGRDLDISDFYAADEDLFKVFSFEFLSGDPSTALRDPGSIVLTERTARSIFGTEQALGKILEFGQGPAQRGLKVTGVIRDVPRNSHFTFNLLISTATLRPQPAAAGQNAPPQRNMLEENYTFGAHSYVLLARPSDRPAVERKIQAVVQERWGDFLRQRGVGRYYELQNLRDLHLKSRSEGELGATGSSQNVALFIVIALLVLFIACFNFINLSTARSTLRAKEVGLKKVFGVYRAQLIRQFLGESVLIAGIGLVLGLLLTTLVLPAFNALVRKSLTFTDILDPGILLGLLAILVLTGLGAGLFPALVLSRFEPVNTIRGRISGNSRGNALRKGLVVVQFGIAVVMIISTIVIVRQVRFLQNKELGFDKNMLVIVRAVGPRNEALKNEIQAHASVRAVSFDGSIPGQFTGDSTFIPAGNSPDDSIRASAFTVGYEFLKTYGIDVLWGRGFSEQFPADAREGLIINETMARDLGWNENAVGRELVDVTSNRNDRFRVVGVVRDFHHKSLKDAINPTVLRLFPAGGAYASIRIRPENVSASIDFLRAAFKKSNPRADFNYFFIDDDFRQKYPNEEKARNIYGYFGILAVFVACLGLYGLASFIIERRTREIGIRKTLGAGFGRIVESLSKEFLGCVLLANLLAWPLAWLLMNRWLGSFPYRVDLAGWVFLLAGGISLVIAALTISRQALRSALINPARALRTE
jgi:putative ABC transport system permease protein